MPKNFEKSCPNCTAVAFHTALTCRECGYDFFLKAIPKVHLPGEPTPRLVQIAQETDAPLDLPLVIAPALGRYGQSPVHPAWLKYNDDGSDESLRNWMQIVRKGWVDQFRGFLTNRALQILFETACTDKTLWEKCKDRIANV